MHRHDRRVQIAGDGFQAALEREQIAGAADGALGKNANDVTALELPAGPADGFRGAVGPLPNGDSLGQPETPGQQLEIVVRMPDQEADQRRKAGADQEGVQMGQMIGNQQGGAIGRGVLPTQDPHAEQRAGDQPKRGPDQKLGKARRDHGTDSSGAGRPKARSHSGLGPWRMVSTDRAGSETMAAATTDLGTGMIPRLHANDSTERASVMVSNSR